MRKVALVLSLACALSLSAQSNWDKLLKGNEAFQGDEIKFENLKKLRRDLQNGQKPPVTILSCSDSRVPPELVFKQTLGQVFLVRSAGNVTDTLGIASMEYAIKKDWTKLLVILAHDKCGAVEEAMRANGDPLPPGSVPLKPGKPGDDRNLAALVGQIKKSFSGKCPDAKQCWMFRTRQNALYTIDDLKSRSPILAEAIKNGLPVAVAYYTLDGKLVVWKAP